MRCLSHALAHILSPSLCLIPCPSDALSLLPSTVSVDRTVPKQSDSISLHPFITPFDKAILIASGTPSVTPFDTTSLSALRRAVFADDKDTDLCNKCKNACKASVVNVIMTLVFLPLCLYTGSFLTPLLASLPLPRLPTYFELTLSLL